MAEKERKPPKPLISDELPGIPVPCKVLPEGKPVPPGHVAMLLKVDDILQHHSITAAGNRGFNVAGMEFPGTYTEEGKTAPVTYHIGKGRPAYFSLVITRR
jgi:hypothetical protein